MVNKDVWEQINVALQPQNVLLIAVSKTKPAEDILELYALGQRHFGENYVQELVDKQAQLPKDIHWHFIGHLQTNKVKYIAPFVHLIHGVDSYKLLAEINKQAKNFKRIIDVLLQVHIAAEDTKFGMDEKELIGAMQQYEANIGAMHNVRICGVMGMASFTEDEQQVHREFATLKNMFTFLKDSYFIGMDYFLVCSMGMSGDYKLAIEEGSTMVRIGSLLFGYR